MHVQCNFIDHELCSVIMCCVNDLFFFFKCNPENINDPYARVHFCTMNMSVTSFVNHRETVIEYLALMSQVLCVQYCSTKYVASLNVMSGLVTC